LHEVLWCRVFVISKFARVETFGIFDFIPLLCCIYFDEMKKIC
jgi:hypothetical protein